MGGGDAISGYFFNVDAVLGGGGHVGGGEFVEEGLVFGDHFGDCFVVYFEADLWEFKESLFVHWIMDGMSFFR